MKARTLKILQSIIDPAVDPEPEIQASDKFFGSLINPKKYTGNDTAELKMEMSFEKICIVLGQFSNKPVKESTTKEYFSLIQHYNKESKKR